MSEKNEDINEEKTNTCEPFYLNLILYNKKEIVQSKVEGRLGTGIFGKLGTGIAITTTITINVTITM